MVTTSPTASPFSLVTTFNIHKIHGKSIFLAAHTVLTYELDNTILFGRFFGLLRLRLEEGRERKLATSREIQMLLLRFEKGTGSRDRIQIYDIN